MDRPVSTRRVIVGVTGSLNSAGALTRAIRKALERDAKLEIVQVVADGTDPKIALEKLDAFVSGVVPDGLGPGAHTCIEFGDPAKTLVRLTKGAELLVIGAQNHSHRMGIFSGDIVSFCIGHSYCPVDVCANHEAEYPAAE